MKTAAKTPRFGSSSGLSQQDDDVCSLRGTHEYRRSEQRDHRPAGGPRGGHEPTRRGHDQHRCDGQRRPQPGVPQRARESRVGVNQEAVVTAVAPAVEVQQRIAEESKAHARGGGDPVRRNDHTAFATRKRTTAGKGEGEVEDQRKQERGERHADGPKERRGALSSLPVGAEPGAPARSASIPRRRIRGWVQASRPAASSPKPAAASATLAAAEAAA